MSSLRIERVSALPATLSRKTGTIYLVANVDPMLVDLYVVGNTQGAIRHIATKAETLGAVANMLDATADELVSITTDQIDALAATVGTNDLDPVLIFNNALL